MLEILGPKKLQTKKSYFFNFWDKKFLKLVDL